MKTLTVRQPWALLIMQGKKTIEVRTWFPEYQGRILIHAGSKVDFDAVESLRIDPQCLAKGVILGSVDLVSVFRFNERSWEELRERTLERSSFDPRFLGWELRNPVWLEMPLPWRGSPGLFDVPDEAIPDAIKLGVNWSADEAPDSEAT